MTTFSLFHLPLVALEHVLYIMNPYELINLSLTSTKSKRAVKRIKPKFSASLEIHSDLSISISKTDESWSYKWISYKPRLGYIEATSTEQYVYKFSKNPIEEMMKFYDYIREVLKCQLDHVGFELGSDSSKNKRITDCLRSYPITRLDISNDDKETDEDMKYAVSNITVIDKMTLDISNYKEDFQMEIPATPYEIFIDESSFINFEQLLRLKNRRIFLYESCVTEKEINLFVKSWMARESHLELEAFNIDVSGEEAMDVIMDLPHKKTADPNVVEIFREKFYGLRIEEGFDIERSDGKLATLGYGDHSDGPRFFMLIR
uniref:FBA_2 domain-containing protein n=2 Tax=Caenorhabditis tropicalis TaxID=1561998 RepID=A0A1I7TH78_9PELO